MKDIAIIGAGPAGVTAAIYAKRAGFTLELFEKAVIGGQAAESGEIENYTAFAKISGMDFCAALTEQLRELEVAPRFETVQSITQGGGFEILTENGTYDAKTVLLANGARPRRLGIDGESEWTGKGVSYCAHCDGAFFKGKTVAVVGGGNSAAESALYLSKLCKKVYMIYRGEKLRADFYLTEQIKQRKNIELIRNSLPEAVLGIGTVQSLRLRQTKNRTVSQLPVEGVFVAIGREPQNTAFSSLVALDQQGYVQTDPYCRTSCPGIFAAGDTRQKTLRQIITACADGAQAVSSIAAFLS